VSEHANIERATAQGGYGRRQIFELVQNSADALTGTTGGRILVLLTDAALYCANEGAPIDLEGVDAILSSHVSMKRGTEIGRFGLGFKSVLGVTNRPEFYSRSGSFGFDPRVAEALIREIVPNADRVPMLRIAQPLDPAAAAAGDPELARLMKWATTVVKLPRDLDQSTWLEEDITDFPAEFVLFSPHVGGLTLRAERTLNERVISLQTGNDEFHLFDGAESTTWRVLHRIHEMSDRGRADAGELADRPRLPIIWAVRPSGRAIRGRFWAFFPTEYITLLSGLLNAPWKTNEDRQNLLKGQFNEELLSAAADIVVANLPKLSNPEDPGSVLDILPGRKEESKNWADERLNELVYLRAAKNPSLPDQSGKLVVPSTLRLHPGDLPREALEMWAAYSGRPQGWCHPSVGTRERRPRAERLLAAAGREASSLSGWLEALVQDQTSVASVAAVCAAGVIVKADPSWLPELRRSHIILTQNGTWVAPNPGRVFLPSSYEAADFDLPIVYSDVALNPEAHRALEALGIEPVDAGGELKRLLGHTYGDDADAGRWTSVWELIRRVDPGRVKTILLETEFGIARLRVRTLSGGYLPLVQTLLPGPIVPEDGGRDAQVTIDTRFHQNDLELLVEFGATVGPTSGRGAVSEPWFWNYRQEAVTTYQASISSKAGRPSYAKLEFDAEDLPGPLEPLRHLTEEGRARFTEAVFGADPDPKPWVLAHGTRRDAYPVRQFPSPVIWLLRREGRLRTSRGVKTVASCVGPGLAELADFFSVVDCPVRTADLLGCPNTPAALRADHWSEAFDVAHAITDDVLLGRFYAAAAECPEDPPTTICCCVAGGHQSVARETATVVTSRRELDALVPRGVPVLLAPSKEAADALVRRWGLLPPDRYVRTEVTSIPSAPEVPLVDAFPTLRVFLTQEQSRLQLVRCSLLRLDTLTDAGKTSEDRVFYLDADAVYCHEDLSTASLVERLASELHLAMTAEDRAAIVEHRGEQERRQRIGDVRQRATVGERLLTAVGPESIRRRLSTDLISMVEQMYGNVSDDRLAELALSVYGVDALRVFRPELEQRGFDPPAQWTGGRDARTFVSALGFPREFAGFRRADRDPLVEVEGRPNLPSLHAFQETIVERTRVLLRPGGENRGLLALPTGAGKTRIAVESLIGALSDETLRGPVLWIAQTDELCEQAVQTWSYVWRALGPERRLSISRLWASNEAERINAAIQVVIATIAKLDVCVRQERYDWLSKASCVVIDEAHGSTERVYTEVLTWLGLGRGTRRCPLIGLTATPFRGVNEEETRRLAARYGGYRLDASLFDGDPYIELQRLGVLARVRHCLVEGSDIRLSEKELEQLQQLRRLPASVEERLGADMKRNRVLLESVKSLPSDWTILLFATSVDHAETMAALLSLEGIPAAVISAGTDPGARRHYIDEFRAGRLRVLTNYGVLAQGFDAPAVRAVYVARPTYSPNAYQQMIGRGLRGPRNGGKDDCLIVNVADNVLRFGEQLAFRHFEYLWNGEHA
jgi:superfamily II DNA or RNA helicase